MNNNTKFLADIVNLKQIINDHRYIFAEPPVLLLKAPMGSGKSFLVEQLSADFIGESVGVIQLLIYKVSTDTYNKYYIEQEVGRYRGATTIETNLTNKVLPVLSNKAIKNNVNNTNKFDQLVLSYTMPMFSVYAEGLISDGLIKSKDITDDMTDKDIVLSYFQNKIVLVDEADYILSILKAFSASPELFPSAKPIPQRQAELIAAAKKFYQEISEVCKALVFITATTTKEFEAILPDRLITINPQNYLQQGDKLKSVFIKSITFVPVVDHGTHNNRIYDLAVDEILCSKPWDKVLILSPNIKVQDYRSLPKDKKIVVLSPKGKLNRASRRQLTSGKDALKNVRFIDLYESAEDAIDGEEITFDSPNLSNTLNDELVAASDIIIITGSSARAASINGIYGNYCIIIDAPKNSSERVQGIGRPRNNPVEVFIIDRFIENDMDRDEKYKRAQDLKTVYTSLLMDDSLIDTVEDLDFTIDNSMIPTETGLIVKYLDLVDTFRANMIRPEIRQGLVPVEERKGIRVQEFMKKNPRLNNSQIVRAWKETTGETLHRNSVIAYRKVIELEKLNSE